MPQLSRPALALIAAAAMSVGAVAASRTADPLIAVLAYGIGICAVLLAAFRPPSATTSASHAAYRVGLASLAIASLVIVLDRHQVVASSAVAPDDFLAVVAAVTAILVAARGPASLRARALVYSLVLATYTVSGAILIHAKPYHSDAVVATHGGAELVMAGRHPYADFDMSEQLLRFGLHPGWRTDLEDGSELDTLNYPALAVLIPVPALAVGITDVRVLYLLEILALIALVAASAAEPWRAFALAAAIGNVAVMRQFVVAGVDPTWAVLLLVAWLARGHRWSAVAIGLAIAVRQTAWPIAPFLLAHAWRGYGRREAIARTAITAAVAFTIHVPFLLGAPGAVIGGITDILLKPLVPGGVGPSLLLPATPRELYLAVATLALSALAVAWWRARQPDRARAALVFPLAALYLASRALQNYFALLPVFTLVEEGRTSTDPRDRRMGS